VEVEADGPDGRELDGPAWGLDGELLHAATETRAAVRAQLARMRRRVTPGI
jgi:hypothetical protein